jgi:hypothetical protein
MFNLNEENLSRIAYNKLSFKEKIALCKSFYSEYIYEKWYVKIFNNFIFISFCIFIFLPLLLKLEKYVNRTWCEEEGFFCDNKKCEYKHYTRATKNRINKAWINRNERKTLEAL